MQKNWKHSWATAIFGTTAFVTTSTSQAEVTVYWEEVTNGGQTDVVATWTGTLNPGEFSSDGFGAPLGLGFGQVGIAAASLDSLGASRSPYVYDEWLGTSVYSGLGIAFSDGPVSGAAVFGFSGSRFFYSGADNDAADTSLINFDSTPHTLTFPNETLVGMNAGYFSDSLAWTSSTGDTISYTTGSPPTGSISAIPEPSSGLVLGSLLLSGLMHRRRK